MKQYQPPFCIPFYAQPQNLPPLSLSAFPTLPSRVRRVAGIPLMRGFASQAEEWAPKAAAAVGSALSDVPQEFNPSPQVCGVCYLSRAPTKPSTHSLLSAPA